jgi:hypothetical protein
MKHWADSITFHRTITGARVVLFECSQVAIGRGAVPVEGSALTAREPSSILGICYNAVFFQRGAIV